MKKTTKWFAQIIYSVVALVFVLGLVLATPLNTSAGFVSSPKSSIKEEFTASPETVVTRYGKGFLMKYPGLLNHPPVLHVQGTPYEMGYQHGYLLSNEITQFYSSFLSPICFMYGGWDPSTGTPPTAQQLQDGYDTLLGISQALFLGPIQAQAPDLYQELEGMEAALHDTGSPVSLNDLIIASCMSDVLNCTNFIAWGDATVNGKLIHAVNLDNQTFDILDKSNIVTIAKPQSGNPYLSVGWVGCIGLTGMNKMGISFGEMDSSTADSNMLLGVPRLPHFMHMRKLYQYSNSIQDAVNIMNRYGGTTGHNIMTADAKVPAGADIEASCNHVVQVNPIPGLNVIWVTNHCLAYPGYQGYDGYNMVKDQASLSGVSWDQIDTIAKWQSWLQLTDSFKTWSRYEKARELITANYGHIDVEKAKQIMSTAPISSTGPKEQLSTPVAHLYSIVKPISNQLLFSIYSCIFVPADGMAWVAAGAAPAQAGTYWPISLDEHLRMMEINSSGSVGTDLGSVTFNINAGSLSGLTAIRPQNIPCVLSSYAFPYGMFSYNITNLTPGQTVTVTITLPLPTPQGVKFFKCQNGKLIDCSQFMTRPNEYTLTLTLTDGGPGDADGVANGIIVDPGGPAMRAGGGNISTTPSSHSSSVSVTHPTPPVALSNISVQNVTLSSIRVTPGTPITVTADILNKSTVNGNKKVTLYVNGEVESTQGVTVNSGSSSQLTFSISRNEPGEYNVYVDGAPAGSFTVEMVTRNDVVLIISATLVAMSFLLGIIILWRRQRIHY